MPDQSPSHWYTLQVLGQGGRQPKQPPRWASSPQPQSPSAGGGGQATCFKVLPPGTSAPGAYPSSSLPTAREGANAPPPSTSPQPTGGAEECWPGLGRPHMKAHKPVRNFYPPGDGGGKGGMSPGNHPPFPSLSGALGVEKLGNLDPPKPAMSFL